MPLDSLSRPPTVDCLSFEAVSAGGAKCKHYAVGGDCALFSICTEWEKKNAAEGAKRRADRATHALSMSSGSPNPATPETAHAATPRGPERRQLALLRDAPPEAATSGSKPRGATIHELGAFAGADGKTTHYGTRGPTNDPTPRGAAPKAPVIEVVGAADVAALAARGYEMCLEGWNGGPDVWLVPKLTGAGRIELTYENAMTLANLTAAFPGARVKVIVNDVTARPETNSDDAFALG